jgi:pSer/pThr/pTyr-binding forkhead associated (FHA) protein
MVAPKVGSDRRRRSRGCRSPQLGSASIVKATSGPPTRPSTRRSADGTLRPMAKRPLAIDATVEASRGPRPGEEAERRGRLISIYPDNLQVILDLAAGPLELGREAQTHGAIGLDHPTVSRRHVRLRFDPTLDAVWVEDLGSRNGTWAGGRKVGEEATLLEPDEVLRIGDVLMVLERGATLDQPEVKEVSQDAAPGRSMAMRRLRRELSRAAPDLSPVLILGATGTGKERLALEVHRLSGRSGRFIPVNCATLAAHLIESQLFGHVKGAFTGAQNDHEGLFVAAENGTLFLDEIGELPLDLQPKLLRAIQEKEVRALGSTKTSKVDVRIVAATHVDIGARAQAGTFRQDLYARLSLWQLRVPPLRDRRADILAFADRLHREWCEERGKVDPNLNFHVEAAERLVRQDWTENLRGLSRLVHELAVRPERGLIRPETLPAWVGR